MVTAVCNSEGTNNTCEGEVFDEHFFCCPITSTSIPLSTTILQPTQKSPRATTESSASAFKDVAVSLESFNNKNHEVDGSRQGGVIGVVDMMVSSSEVNAASSFGSIITSNELLIGKKREMDGSVRGEALAHPISDVVSSSSSASGIVRGEALVVSSSDVTFTKKQKVADKFQVAGKFLSSSSVGNFIEDAMFYLHQPTCDEHCLCLQCRPGAVAFPKVDILEQPIFGMVVESFPSWTHDVKVPHLEGEFIKLPWQCLLFESQHSNDSTFPWEMSGFNVVIVSLPLGTSVSSTELKELQSISEALRAAASQKDDLMQSSSYPESDADESVVFDASSFTLSPKSAPEECSYFSSHSCDTKSSSSSNVDDDVDFACDGNSDPHQISCPRVETDAPTFTGTGSSENVYEVCARIASNDAFIQSVANKPYQCRIEDKLYKLRMESVAVYNVGKQIVMNEDAFYLHRNLFDLIGGRKEQDIEAMLDVLIVSSVDRSGTLFLHLRQAILNETQPRLSCDGSEKCRLHSLLGYEHRWSECPNNPKSHFYPLFGFVPHRTCSNVQLSISGRTFQEQRKIAEKIVSSNSSTSLTLEMEEAPFASNEGCRTLESLDTVDNTGEDTIEEESVFSETCVKRQSLPRACNNDSDGIFAFHELKGLVAFAAGAEISPEESALSDNTEPSNNDDTSSCQGSSSDRSVGNTDDESIKSDNNDSIAPDEEDLFLWSAYENCDPRRMNAKSYAPIVRRGTESMGKIFAMTDDEAISLLEAPCICCGREHTPNCNPVNTIDRLESHYGVYAPALCCTLCQDCNGLKLWLNPAEFMGKVISWYNNRAHIIKSCCRSIRDVKHLEELASQSPDGVCGKIPQISQSGGLWMGGIFSGHVLFAPLFECGYPNRVSHINVVISQRVVISHPSL